MLWAADRFGVSIAADLLRLFRMIPWCLIVVARDARQSRVLQAVSGLFCFAGRDDLGAAAAALDKITGGKPKTAPWCGAATSTSRQTPVQPMRANIAVPGVGTGGRRPDGGGSSAMSLSAAMNRAASATRARSML